MASRREATGLNRPPLLQVRVGLRELELEALEVQGCGSEQRLEDHRYGHSESERGVSVE
jgi:hypothetical protein